MKASLSRQMGAIPRTFGHHEGVKARNILFGIAAIAFGLALLTWTGSIRWVDVPLDSLLGRPSSPELKLPELPPQLTDCSGLPPELQWDPAGLDGRSACNGLTLRKKPAFQKTSVYPRPLDQVFAGTLAAISSSPALSGWKISKQTRAEKNAVIELSNGVAAPYTKLLITFEEKEPGQTAAVALLY